MGAPLVRIYLDDPIPGADAALRRAGYERRIETIACGIVEGAMQSGLRILPVADRAGWDRKLALHRAAPELPDCHRGAGLDWVELERRKCATGWMVEFVVEHDRDIVGAAAIIPDAALYRLKNLVIHPGWRRRGIGLDVIRWASALALADGRSGICVLAVAGGAGDQLYDRAGLTPVGRRVEWTKLC